MPEIKIKLRESSYSVYAGFPLEKISGKMMHPCMGNKVLILSDRNVFPLYGEIVRESIRSAGKEVSEMVLPAGEKTKNFNQLLRIIEALCANKMNRDDTVITLGGGVISDIGGFAASIYMRGINFAAVPTTLLAQVDAAIGGKTAVNLPFGKNLAGTFYQPSFVYIDFAVLDTLPEREVRQGVSEIIKYGIIRSRKIFDIMEDCSRDIRREYRFLIKESIIIKKDVVEKDEKERKGLREILNFGHTLGHAFEICNFPKLSHGEAVAIGMAGESYISYKLGISSKDTFERIINTLKKRGLPSTMKGIKIDEALDFLRYDKKVRQGRVRFVLPEEIGSVRTGVPLKANDALEILKTFPQEKRR